MKDPRIIDIGEQPGPEYDQPSNQTYRIFEPLSSKGWPRWLVYTIAAIGVIYILNPTMGVLELIPDNLPIIGNLDEGAAFAAILAGVVEYLASRKA